MTGCGCLLLVALLVGLIVFMLFGSTDAGDPVAGAVVVSALAGWVALVPLRRALERARRA